MIDIYTAIVFITVLLLIITAADAFTNRLITKKMKKNSIIVCILTGVAIFCEWIGVKTNGASVSLIWLHSIAKLIEFCMAPAIGVAAAIAYGKVNKTKTVIGLLIVHSAFEILSMFKGWVFSVDVLNVYHREELYWIYIAAFSVSTIYCFACIVYGGKKYQARFDSVLILTLCLLAAGVMVQMVNSEIRVDFMCVAIGNNLLYNHSCKVVLQVDMVTRLLNRRCYERNIENLKSPAYVLIFDINNFKRINDTYGHSAGDLCLKKVAEQLFGIYGKYGFCYRIGGDEFCVILNKNLENLKNLNRQFTDAMELMSKGNPKVSDVALGYSYYNPEKSDIRKVIEEADEMMYNNKR